MMQTKHQNEKEKNTNREGTNSEIKEVQIFNISSKNTHEKIFNIFQTYKHSN